MDTTEQHDVIVIGAGQAGLATAYHLERRGREVVLLEADQRVGDVWRRRYDSLRLYSPAQYDGLPGWDLPLPRWTYPTKDQVADYLEAYAARFDLDVRTGSPVLRLGPASGDRRDGYVVRTATAVLRARNVVIATGTWQVPKVPDFAAELDPSIVQLHSADYRNLGQLQPGPVLVVGAAHSGADLALEAAGTHPTTLAGPIRGQIPFTIDGASAHVALPLLWVAANRVLTVGTPIGRKARGHVLAHGGPLLRVKQEHLAAAGVVHTPEKVIGVRRGQPVLADGEVLDVRNVLWCTGFRHDMSWVDLPLETEAEGLPVQDRGVVTSAPGLYFVGLPFLSSAASMLVGGVRRDAARIAKHISRRAAEPETALVPVLSATDLAATGAQQGQDHTDH